METLQDDEFPPRALVVVQDLYVSFIRDPRNQERVAAYGYFNFTRYGRGVVGIFGSTGELVYLTAEEFRARLGQPHRIMEDVNNYDPETEIVIFFGDHGVPESVMHVLNTNPTPQAAYEKSLKLDINKIIVLPSGPSNAA